MYTDSVPYAIEDINQEEKNAENKSQKIESNLLTITINYNNH